MRNNLDKQIKKQKKQGYFKKILPYIALQTKLSFKPAIPEKLWKRIVKWVIALVIFGLFLYIAFLFLKSLVTQTSLLPPESVCILLYTIAQIVILVIGITSQVKRLNGPNDLKIISSFPLTSFQRYLGEVVAIYIKLGLMSLIVFWPIMIVYGCAGSMFTVAFAFSSLFATILLPLMPFAISMILAIPFMFVSSWIKDKNTLKLILFIIFFAAILVLYGFILHLMADWYVHAKTNVEVIKGLKAFVDAINHPYNICFFASEICLMNNIGANFGIYLAITIAAGAIGMAITKPLYDKFCNSAKNYELAAKTRTTKLTNYSPTKTIFIKEFKQIVRNPMYAYFFLGVAFAMPIVTYLIIDLVRKLGESSVGSNGFFGFILLTICIVISLIGSFSANTIAREGNEFYITKIAPISYRKQMFAKLLVHFTVTFAALLLCNVVIGCTSVSVDQVDGTITPLGMLMIFLASTFFLVGIIFNGANINLIRPKVQLHNGKTDESNIVIQLVIGIIITAILSVACIVTNGIDSKNEMIVQNIVWVVMFVYALINFLVFFFTCEKAYARMEVK